MGQPGHGSCFALKLIACTKLIFKKMLAPFTTYKSSTECWLPMVTDPQAENTITFSILSVLFGDLRTDPLC